VFTCEAVHPTSPRVFATLRYLEGAGSRFGLHIGRRTDERASTDDPTDPEVQMRKFSMIRTKESPI
jgi:hypothetical protein